MTASETPQERDDRETAERAKFGCTAQEIDETIASMTTRDVIVYAIGTLSNAQQLIKRDPYGSEPWTVTDRDADTIRRLINVAKYVMDKAVPL